MRAIVVWLRSLPRFDVKAFIKRCPVLVIALGAALLTMLFVPPDAAYAGYFDWRTLSCLFCVLAVVRALSNVSFFYRVAHGLVRVFKNARACLLALVVTTFVGSMLIANDMALITFLPLGYFVLHTTGQEKRAAFTFIMQNIAANLGGMLTPFGNPQNLYLYSRFAIPFGEFVSIMAAPFGAAVALILLCCLFVKPEPMTLPDEHGAMPQPLKTAAYLALFALSILIVFRGVPYWIGLVVIPVTLFFMDRNALKTVDYPLLATFCCFFVFAGNMARMDLVRDAVCALLQRDTLLVGAASCQVISNVPSAILLAQFTDNYRELLWAVNLGGTGTLVASLASLITYGEFCRHYPDKRRAYLIRFALLNLLFLAVLLAFCLLIR